MAIAVRTDPPFADYVPGQGCGCKLCQEPLPEVAPLNPLEAAMLGHHYGGGRAGEEQRRAEPDAGIAFEIEPT